MKLILEKNTININPKIKKATKTLKTYWPFYVMFLPVAIYYILFAYIPMAGVIIAFKDFNFKLGIFSSSWVGLEHFSRFLSNGDFWRVFCNTVVISMLRILVGFPAPIIFALLLNELRLKKFKRFVQTISYLPHFISWVVVGGMLYSLFSSSGVVNSILQDSFNKQSIDFLANEKYFKGFLVGTAIWKEVGWSAIIYLAALSGVDTQLYEAAVIDGANRRQQLVYVTLPSLSGVMSIMFVLSFATVLSTGFEQVMALINPAVISVGETIDYYIYRVGVTQINNYSYASAVGLFKSVISFVLVILANWGAKKIDEESGIW